MKINALSRAVVWTIALIVVMTIAGELSEAFKTFLKNIAGHHWITKSVFALVFFVLLYIILPRDKKVNIKRESLAVFWTALLGATIIFVFFVWHFFA